VGRWWRRCRGCGRGVCRVLPPWLVSARTRRALFGRHAAADASGGSNSGLAGCARPVRTRYLHSARMILSDVLTCTVPPLRVESSLLKTPIPAKNSGLTRTRQICTQNSIKVEDALLTPPWLPPPDGMALEPALEWAAAVAKVVTAAAALLASSPWQPPSLLLSPRGAPSEQPAPNRGSSRGRASATAPTIRPLVWRLQTRRPIADFLFRRNFNPKGATRETGDLIKASMGFTSVSRSYYYLRRRSPGPPFPPDHRQAGERGAITTMCKLIGGSRARSKGKERRRRSHR
jgi:hypothetical protein